jgi:hypothetical protein
MISPRIEFREVSTSRRFHHIHSSKEAIRFRVSERTDSTTFDADWFRTEWKLAPVAGDLIFSHCEGRAFEWGGGAACLIIRVKTPVADQFKQFLAEVLSNPSSWLRWNREQQEFVPLPHLQEAA